MSYERRRICPTCDPSPPRDGVIYALCAAHDKRNTVLPDKKRLFVAALAAYLGGPVQAEMSIGLAMPPGTTRGAAARRWAALRAATPLFGYLTVDEAEAQLAEWLGVAL